MKAWRLVLAGRRGKTHATTQGARRTFCGRRISGDAILLMRVALPDDVTCLTCRARLDRFVAHAKREQARLRRKRDDNGDAA